MRELAIFIVFLLLASADLAVGFASVPFFALSTSTCCSRLVPSKSPASSLFSPPPRLATSSSSSSSSSPSRPSLLRLPGRKRDDRAAPSDDDGRLSSRSSSSGPSPADLLAEVVSSTSSRMSKSVSFLSTSLSSLRPASSASASLLSSVTVRVAPSVKGGKDVKKGKDGGGGDAGPSYVPLADVASVELEPDKSSGAVMSTIIRITPFEKKNTAILSAIVEAFPPIPSSSSSSSPPSSSNPNASNLLLTSGLLSPPSISGSSVTLSMRPLTSEGRLALKASVSRRGAELLVALRNVRQDGMKRIKDLAADKNKPISKDQKRDGEDAIDKEMEKWAKKGEEMVEKKGEECLKM